jgi:hypothetical protein
MANSCFHAMLALMPTQAVAPLSSSRLATAANDFDRLVSSKVGDPDDHELLRCYQASNDADVTRRTHPLADFTVTTDAGVIRFARACFLAWLRDEFYMTLVSVPALKTAASSLAEKWSVDPEYLSRIETVWRQWATETSRGGTP